MDEIWSLASRNLLFLGENRHSKVQHNLVKAVTELGRRPGHALHSRIPLTVAADVCRHNHDTRQHAVCFMPAVVSTLANKYYNSSKERKSPLSGVITPTCSDEELIEKIGFKVDLGQILIYTYMYHSCTL